MLLQFSISNISTGVKIFLLKLTINSSNSSSFKHYCWRGTIHPSFQYFRQLSTVTTSLTHRSPTCTHCTGESKSGKKCFHWMKRSDINVFLLSAGLVFWQLCFSAANGFSVSLPFSSPSSHQRSELSSFLFIRWSNNLDFKLTEFSSSCSFQYFGSSILALSVAAACMGHLEKAIWSNPDVRTYILQLTNTYMFFFSIRRKTQRLK